MRSKLWRKGWPMTARTRTEQIHRKLSQCPGFVGADVNGVCRVVIEPAFVMEAYTWLNRRFIVSENLDLSLDTGLVLEVVPRTRKVAVRRCNPFIKPEQYQLNFG
jgi:hypothetical protein